MCVAVRAERLLSPFRTWSLASHVGWPWNNVRFARRRGVSVKVSSGPSSATSRSTFSFSFRRRSRLRP